MTGKVAPLLAGTNRPSMTSRSGSVSAAARSSQSRRPALDASILGRSFLPPILWQIIR